MMNIIKPIATIFALVTVIIQVLVGLFAFEYYRYLAIPMSIVVVLYVIAISRQERRGALTWFPPVIWAANTIFTVVVF